MQKKIKQFTLLAILVLSSTYIPSFAEDTNATTTESSAATTNTQNTNSDNSIKGRLKNATNKIGMRGHKIRKAIAKRMHHKAADPTSSKDAASTSSNQ